MKKLFTRFPILKMTVNIAMIVLVVTGCRGESIRDVQHKDIQGMVLLLGASHAGLLTRDGYGFHKRVL